MTEEATAPSAPAVDALPVPRRAALGTTTVKIKLPRSAKAALEDYTQKVNAANALAGRPIVSSDIVAGTMLMLNLRDLGVLQIGMVPPGAGPSNQIVTATPESLANQGVAL